jgi:hypothetical protein
MTDTVPTAILRQLKHHLAVVADFATEVLRCRALEASIGVAGRYEQEYRIDQEALAWDSQTWISRFQIQCHTRGIDAQAVIAAHGGIAQWPAWPKAAREWRAERAHKIHQA